MAAVSKGLPHRSDHSYDERDDIFFDSDDDKDSAELVDNSDEGTSLASSNLDIHSPLWNRQEVKHEGIMLHKFHQQM